MKKGLIQHRTVEILMKYHSGEKVSVGDRVTFNNQRGCIALIAGKSSSGSPSIKEEEWSLNEGEVLILFENGALLTSDDVQNDELLVFCGQSG